MIALPFAVVAAGACAFLVVYVVELHCVAGELADALKALRGVTGGGHSDDDPIRLAAAGAERALDRARLLRIRGRAS